MTSNSHRFFALALATCAAGCASTSTDSSGPAAAPRAQAVVRIHTDRGGAEFPLADADVSRFAARFAAHTARGRTACARQLVSDSPDLALEAFRRAVGRTDSDSGSLRLGIAKAWEEAFSETALKDGEEGRRARPAETAAAVGALVAALGARDNSGGLFSDAASKFELAGDFFWAEECRRLAAMRAPASLERREAAPAPTSAQAGLRSLEFARAASLLRQWAPCREAIQQLMEESIRRRDLALAADVEDLRTQPEIAAAFGPSETRRWLVKLGGLALERRLHLMALRCAMTARDAAPSAIDPEGRDAARRLFARASAARGDRALALRAAEGLLDEARATNRRAEEAAAAALCAEILLSDGRGKEAAGLFLHAAGVSGDLSMEVDRARHRLSAAGAFLSAGLLGPCRDELEALRGTAAGATGSTGRRARFAVTLYEAARQDDELALRRVTEVLAEAEGAGDYALVEQCEGVKARVE